jgi:chromosome segregation ATPase
VESLNSELLKAIEVMLKRELEPIKTEIGSIRSEIGSMKTEIGSIRSEIGSMKTEIGSMKTEIKSMRTQLDEHTQILRALEHKADVSKAEQDKMSNDIAYIKGDIKALRKDITNVEIITSSNWNDIAKLKSVK